MQPPSVQNVSMLTGVQRLFYLISPYDSMFEKVEEVPNYVVESTPAFLMLILLESIILFLQGRPLPRVDDTITSVGAGILSRLPSLFMRAIEMVAYLYVWENYRIAELPWNSVWTWLFVMMAVDHGYYWVHRCAHEVNFMWAAHQVHHSSEDYNLATALRQSVLQAYSSWIFYLPLALVIPPSVFLVHIQFNLLYQFWIHTELVGWLGPLEYIINTPSAHRVHHGRNRYCIDKNYGGTFIIFDILYGTFAKEDRMNPKNKVVYGLVHPLESRNAIYVQFCHWEYMIRTALTSRSGSFNKVYTFLKGPGWEPGKPRMGNIEDIPDVTYPQPKYETKASLWLNMYAILHFIVIMIVNQLLHENRMSMEQSRVLIGIAWSIATLTCLGSLFDYRSYSPLLEWLRCSLTCVYLMSTLGQISDNMARVSIGLIVLFGSSAGLWLLTIAQQVFDKLEGGNKKLK